MTFVLLASTAGFSVSCISIFTWIQKGKWTLLNVIVFRLSLCHTISFFSIAPGRLWEALGSVRLIRGPICVGSIAEMTLLSPSCVSFGASINSFMSRTKGKATLVQWKKYDKLISTYFIHNVMRYHLSNREVRIYRASVNRATIQCVFYLLVINFLSSHYTEIILRPT